MSSLIAYVPVLHAGYMKWFSKHWSSTLFLIGREYAVDVLPRLNRNIAAIPADMLARTIRMENLIRRVEIFAPSRIHSDRSYIMPDEDVSHALYGKYLRPFNPEVRFENIFLRYDMMAVKRESPVMADLKVSRDEVDALRLKVARKVASQSPDWWRQVGAVLFRGNECLAYECNRHYPDEYHAGIFGDPRMNYDAGEHGKYLSLHAEKAVIAMCADRGISTHGTSLYVTVFPCEDCARVIRVAGIKRVFFEEGYSSLDAQNVLRDADIEIIQVKSPESA